MATRLLGRLRLPGGPAEVGHRTLDTGHVHYQEACDFLFNLPSWLKGGYKPGLDRIRALLEVLGRPERAYPIVHVAGTNGKGSVCAMIAAMASEAGHRVGLHTSPHLFSFTERMRVNGIPADEQWVAESTAKLAGPILDVGATFFEASTAMTLEYFADRDVDLAIVEVGMGGRLDATNIVSPVLSVITNIGFDHTEHLGKTLAAIAAEKAGIIKNGVPVVSGACVSEAAGVIRAAAQRADSHLTTTCDLNPDLVLAGITLDLPGSHQIANALVAVTAADELGQHDAGLRFDRRGLAEIRRLSGLRGRCEILSRKPTIVADVAHNVEGITAALRFMRDAGLTSNGLDVLIGLSQDKDVSSVMEVLASFGAAVHLAQVDNPRLAPPEKLADAARLKGLRIVEIGSPNELVKRFRETSSPSSSLLATGSHFVIGALTQELFKAAGDSEHLGGGTHL